MSAAMPEGYLGGQARITSAPAPELIAAGFRLETADAPLLHRGLCLADLAHIQALAELKVIPARPAVRLQGEILRILSAPPEEFPYDERYGDPYNSREHELERRLGHDAGWLHTGRTRREAGRIAFRVGARAAMLRLHEAVSGFADALRTNASAHAHTLWADHTYLQPAQPSTFGHYLGGFAEACLRDLERVKRATEALNESPAGAGGVGGSRVPFDRNALAQALGFTRPAPHIRDAMWSIDSCVEAAMAAVLSAITADRLAEDLEIFASPAFGYVSLHAELSRASVLLPQKRNPYALAVIRAGANHLIGTGTGILVSGRTPSARTDNWLHLYGDLNAVIARADELIRLATRVVTGLEVHKEVLAAAAEQHFTGAADLAEEMVLSEGVDYRTTYRVVGRAVADSIAADESHLTLDAVKSAAATLGDISLDWDEARFASAASPLAIVSSRTALGGSGPDAVRNHSRQIRQDLKRSSIWRSRLQARIAAAEEALIERAQASVAAAPFRS